MCNFIMAALLVLFSINGVASAGGNEIFEIEADGSYRMEAGSSIDLAKKVAIFIAKRKAKDLAGRYLSREGLIENLFEPSGEKIPELGQHIYGQSHDSLQ